MSAGNRIINPKVLGIIPARGASKSIPRKNIAPLAGKPLIAWTIETALSANALDRVIVSTEDEEIAETALRYGAEVPFKRPLELAGDETPGIEPIIHAVSWLQLNDDYNPDYVMVLQPTSPLRSKEDIVEAITLRRVKSAEAVVSVFKAPYHPYWMKVIDENGCLKDFIDLDQEYSSRQFLPPVYALNGAIYLIKREILMERKTLFPPGAIGYEMPVERSVDIDEPWDFQVAELLLKERMKDAGTI